MEIEASWQHCFACLKLLQAKKKKNMNFMENLLPRKNSINYGLDFDDTKANNLINAKGKNPNNTISSKANSEEGHSQRSMVMGHIAHTLAFIKGDVVVVEDPPDAYGSEGSIEEKGFYAF
jgi:hypothetical protein